MTEKVGGRRRKIRFFSSSAFPLDLYISLFCFSSGLPTLFRFEGGNRVLYLVRCVNFDSDDDCHAQIVYLERLNYCVI